MLIAQISASKVVSRKHRTAVLRQSFSTLTSSCTAKRFLSGWMNHAARIVCSRNRADERVPASSPETRDGDVLLHRREFFSRAGQNHDHVARFLRVNNSSATLSKPPSVPKSAAITVRSVLSDPNKEGRGWSVKFHSLPATWLGIDVINRSQEAQTSL